MTKFVPELSHVFEYCLRLYDRGESWYTAVDDV